MGALVLRKVSCVNTIPQFVVKVEYNHVPFSRLSENEKASRSYKSTLEQDTVMLVKHTHTKGELMQPRYGLFPGSLGVA